jgi:2,4-dienoyl-CoA reductase-like NADH-dependent reductase (Old Yellow Enzyme family)
VTRLRRRPPPEQRGRGIQLDHAGRKASTPQDGPGYQVPFARRVREVSGLPLAAVGQIDGPRQAEKSVGGADVHWPDQYLRARP